MKFSLIVQNYPPPSYPGLKMTAPLRSVVQIADLSNDALSKLMLYGDNDLSNNLNRSILELTLRFIHETGRFD